MMTPGQPLAFYVLRGFAVLFSIAALVPIALALAELPRERWARMLGLLALAGVLVGAGIAFGYASDAYYHPEP